MQKNTFEDINLSEFKELRIQPNTVVVDVREPWEFEEFNEGGVNIPLPEIRNQRKPIENYQQLIVICTNGVRSKIAAMDYCRVPEWLDKKIFHLKGGIIESE